MHDQESRRFKVEGSPSIFQVQAVRLCVRLHRFRRPPI